MIVDGSIQIRSDEKLYLHDRKLCCKQEETDLLDDYNQYIRDTNKMNPHFNKTEESKWNDYQIKRYECHEIEGRLFLFNLRIR